MAKLVAAFGTSHSTMLFSSIDHWIEMFDDIDRKAPIHDFEGAERSFDWLLDHSPPDAEEKLSGTAMKRRHAETQAALDRLSEDIASADLDALIVVGDDQREIFQEDNRPAIGIYSAPSIRNAAAPATPPANWYVADQRRRLEDEAERHYPCHADLAGYLINGLMEQRFDIASIGLLPEPKFEGHAYSFVHRRLLAPNPIPIVPIFLNTYYPPNQPTPRRCHALGTHISDLVAAYHADLRVGIMASGGLSHFLVNESLDRKVIAAIGENDHKTLIQLPSRLLQGGSSEIRNWICAAGAAKELSLNWITYIPAYRSKALTGVGLCFAHWS